MNEHTSDLTNDIILGAITSAYALKGAQMEHKCTWFDVLAVCSSFNEVLAVADAVKITGYKRFAIYQKLKKVEERGYIIQIDSRKRMYRYKLTDKGINLRSTFIRILTDRRQIITGHKRTKVKHINSLLDNL